MVDVWVFTVAKNRPQNWELGRDNQIWATTKHFSVRKGDLLIFREPANSNRILALALAAEQPRPVTDRSSLPWQDPADPVYTMQWRLTGIREPRSNFALRWADLQLAVLGTTPASPGPLKSTLPAELVLSNLTRLFGVDVSYPTIAAELDWPSSYEPSRNAGRRQRRPFTRSQRDGQLPDKPGDFPDSRPATADGSNRHESLLFRFKAQIEAAGAAEVSEGVEDIVWISNQRLHIAEVKSTSSANEVAQLRLGLGQVLEYLHAARADLVQVQGWLVVEFQPSEHARWVEVCRSVNVNLWWPGKDLEHFNQAD